jgi:hypothetical protein
MEKQAILLEGIDNYDVIEANQVQKNMNANKLSQFVD